MAHLKTQNLSLRYHASAPLISFPDLTVGAGDKLLLLGESGCGKSSFLSIIAGLLNPTSGQVLVDDTDLYRLGRQARDYLRGQKFGFVFQNFHLLPSLTLLQNVVLAADMAGVDVPKEYIEKTLSSLGLTDVAHHKPSALSQGQQQRAALARAVIHSPAFIIADEPTSSLDDKNADVVIGLLEQQAKGSGSALIVATHDTRIKHRFDNVITLSPLQQDKIAS